MDFLNKVGDAWRKGIKGTEEVPLEPGIQAVLRVAQKAEQDKQQTKVKETMEKEQ